MRDPLLACDKPSFKENENQKQTFEVQVVIQKPINMQ